ncbi:hypothetical protein H3S89_03280 [Bartonella sp. B10834G6]|uniref:hypothetical protein n=1 Tax=Bartonella TaxID=773 RepID=UPI0018DB023B|nr:MULTISPECIES: hypothetical protein [Bartonella]MBH9981818.1 hypothetical protein [Bartonella apis]MBI0169847.1 hypothetical protein [Bartonella sp. W8167]MBI0176175.1 hypothetical protein [Bartonella apis]
MNTVTTHIDCNDNDLLAIHDELLAHAKRGGVYLSSSDCRRMALQIIFELAKNPRRTVVPMPFPLVSQPVANENYEKEVA